MGKKKAFISIDKFLAQPRQTKILTFRKNIEAQSTSLLAMCLKVSFFRIELFSFLTLKCFKTLKMVCKEFNQILSSDISIIQRDEIFKKFVKKNRFDLIELYFISLTPEKSSEIDFFQTLDNFKTEFKYDPRFNKSIRNNAKHSTTFFKAAEVGSVKTLKWLLHINETLKHRIITRHWISSEVLPTVFRKNQVKVMKYLLSLPGVHPYYIRNTGYADAWFLTENWKMTEFICSQRLRFPKLHLKFLYGPNVMKYLFRIADLETLMYFESLEPKMKGFKLDSELMTYVGECGNLDIMEWMVWVRPELRPKSFAMGNVKEKFSCSRFSEKQIVAFLESIATEPLNFTFIWEDPSNPQSKVKEIQYGYSKKKKEKGSDDEAEEWFAMRDNWEKEFENELNHLHLDIEVDVKRRK